MDVPRAVVRRARKETRARLDHWRTDVYAVSFPKAGRTWLRVMVGKALCDLYGLPEDRLLDTPFLSQRAGILQTQWTHDGAGIRHARRYDQLSSRKTAYKNKRVLLLTRNVKDLLVSCYFQATARLQRFEGSISEFIRDDRWGAQKVLTFYNQWFASRETPRSLQVIRYEDLHEDAQTALAETLEFMGAGAVGDETLARAVDYANFEAMKEMERKKRFVSSILRPRDDEDADSFKVRRGLVGGYVDYLGDDDIRYIAEVAGDLGDPFGLEKR